MPARYARSLGPALLALPLVGIIALVAWKNSDDAFARAHRGLPFHGNPKGGGFPLASGENNHFRASGDCYGCHGPDLVHNFSMVDEDGNDVNVVDHWRSTMMANSARDPLWRAKVSHEVTVNPAHQAALEDKCTSCHAPAGRYDKFLSGLGHFSMAELAIDPIAQDGVSCQACHMMGPDSIGLLFSGNLKYDTSGVAYGPYSENIFASPMTSFFGIEPRYGAHINDAGLCAGCHTLITETADLNGNPTGDHFVEQATYHEWLNSVFNNNTNPEGGITCQGCHMPRIDDAVVISANYLFLEGRSPFGLHHLAGANTFMLGLMRDNIATLGLTASSAHFDSTIHRTLKLIQQNALLLDAWMAGRNADTAFIEVKLENLGGHKFPSGYPARRAFVELTVLNEAGDTLFSSGRWNGQYEVEGHDPEWEPHYDVITQPHQAQIYELVMGDVNGNRTTVLERAKFPLKDNRLAPLGFTTTHPSYDTTLIAGVPPSDVDFNRFANGQEGSATDIVHYHVPMYGYTGPITVKARVWYQSVPPRFLTEMFAYNTPEIDLFRDLYEAAEPAPVLVREVEFVDTSTGIDDLHELGVRIFPNPTGLGMVRIEGLSELVTSVEVYALSGALLHNRTPNGQRTLVLPLPPGKATYLVVVRTRERDFVERVVTF